jgi:SOS-response transcriptional repressor LexA
MTMRRNPRGRTRGQGGGSGRYGRDEWERDALVWLVGQSLDPVVPSDVADARWARAQECFWEWVGRDAVRQATVEEDRVTARTADALAARAAANVAFAVRAVRRVDHGPTVMAPAVRGPVARVLDRAQRAHAAPLIELGVAAGVGRELWDEPTDAWVVLPPPPEVPDRRYVALRVVGDSMLPLLHSGDVVLVDVDGEAGAGAVVVARQGDGGGEGGGYVVKQVGARTETTLELTSLNPAYPPTHIPLDRGFVLGPVVLRWCDHGATTAEGT